MTDKAPGTVGVAFAKGVLDRPIAALGNAPRIADSAGAADRLLQFLLVHLRTVFYA